MKRSLRIEPNVPLLVAAIVSGVAVPALGQQTIQSSESVQTETGSLERLLASRPVVNRALTIDAAVAIALQESPVVRGAAEEVQAAEGRLRAARAETRPWLSANTFASGGSNSNIVPSPMTVQPQMIMGLPRDVFFDQNLMVMYPLYTGGRLSALIRQAAAIRNASRGDFATQQQEVALMTRVAYREVLARRALVAVAQARLTENQERLRVDQSRLQQGAVPALTVQRDEAEVAAAQQEVTNAQRDVDTTLVNLKTIMGINPGSQLELTDTNEYQPSIEFLRMLVAQAPPRGSQPTPRREQPAPPQTPPATTTDSGSQPGLRTAEPALPATASSSASQLDLSATDTAPSAGAADAASQQSPSVRQPALSADLSALLRLAEHRRPELQAASERITGARAETAAAQSAFRPQVNLFAMGDLQASRGSSGFAGTTFGVVASLPLYNGGERHARVQTAEAERRRQQQDRERLALQIGQEVSTSLLNLRAAEQNIQTARKAQSSAQEGYHVALQRYEAGRSTNVEVLDALAARTQADSNVVQALYFYNVARDQLLRAVGNPADLRQSSLLPSSTVPNRGK